MKKKIIDKDTENAIVYDYSKLCLQKLAKKYGTDYRRVRQILIDAGIQLKPVGDPCKLTDEDKAQIIEDYKYMSMYNIATKHKTAVGIVKQILICAGVDVPKRKIR